MDGSSSSSGGDAGKDAATHLGTKWLKGTLTAAGVSSGGAGGAGTATIHVTFYESTKKLCGKATTSNLPSADALKLYDGFPSFQFFPSSGVYEINQTGLTADNIKSFKMGLFNYAEIGDANDTALVGGALVDDPTQTDDVCP